MGYSMDFKSKNPLDCIGIQISVFISFYPGDSPAALTSDFSAASGSAEVSTNPLVDLAAPFSFEHTNNPPPKRLVDLAQGPQVFLIPQDLVQEIFRPDRAGVLEVWPRSMARLG